MRYSRAYFILSVLENAVVVILLVLLYFRRELTSGALVYLMAFQFMLQSFLGTEEQKSAVEDLHFRFEKMERDNRELRLEVLRTLRLAADMGKELEHK